MDNASIINKATRQVSRVYLGGLSPMTDRASVTSFFNYCMVGIGASSIYAAPVLEVILHLDKKFGEVVMRSVNEATDATCLNGIVFNGYPIKVGRPKDYIPALAKILGRTNPTANLNLAAVGLGPDRLLVEEFPYYFPTLLVRLLLESFGPLASFDYIGYRGVGVTGKRVFCLYHKRSDTIVACDWLKNFDVGGKTLTVTRTHEEILYGQQNIVYMVYKRDQERTLSQMLKRIDELREELLFAELASTVISLTPVVDEYEYQARGDDGYEKLMRKEGRCFGELIRVVIPRRSPSNEAVPGLGKVFLEYENSEMSTKARKELNGRKIGENVVVAQFYPKDRFEQGDYGAA